MSYDLNNLHAMGGVQAASIRFATSSDVAGLSFIPATANIQHIIHQVFFTASSWTQVQLGRSTGAASSYWVGYAGQTQLSESTRIVIDAGASCVADIGSIAVTTGSGVLRAWFTSHPAPTTGSAGIGNL
jgi:hypothetical protein